MISSVIGSLTLKLLSNLAKYAQRGNGTYEDMAQSGREYVKSNDWEAIVDKFENTLNNLIEKF